MQFQSLSGCKRSGKHERYEIVAFSLQLRSLDGLVLKKLIFCARLPGPHRLAIGSIPKHLKGAELSAQQMRVQQPREFPHGLGSTRCWEKMAEVQQQAQRIRSRQIPAHLVPLLYEIAAILRRRQERLQHRCRIVVESQIGRTELLVQDRHSREQSHGFTFNSVRWAQPDLPLPLEVRARNPAANVLGKRQRAIVKIEVEIRAVNRGLAHA